MDISSNPYPSFENGGGFWLQRIGCHHSIWGVSLQGDGVVNHWYRYLRIDVVTGRQYHCWYVVLWGDETLVSYTKMSCFHDPSGIWRQEVRVCVNDDILMSLLTSHFARIIITVQMHRSSEQCGWIGWFSPTCKIDDTRVEFNGQSIPSSGFDPMMIANALLSVAKLMVT